MLLSIKCMLQHNLMTYWVHVLRWIFALLCLVAILGGGSVHARRTRAAVESLGRIVYLPDANDQGNVESRPNIFDSENVLEVAKTENLDRDSMKAKFFENSNLLRQEVKILALIYFQYLYFNGVLMTYLVNCTESWSL